MFHILDLIPGAAWPVLLFVIWLEYIQTPPLIKTLKKMMASAVVKERIEMVQTLLVPFALEDGRRP